MNTFIKLMVLLVGFALVAVYWADVRSRGGRYVYIKDPTTLAVHDTATGALYFSREKDTKTVFAKIDPVRMSARDR